MMNMQGALREAQRLRVRMQSDSRLRLEVLAALSRTFRENSERVSDDLLRSLVFAIPEELPGEGAWSRTAVRAATKKPVKIPPQPGGARRRKPVRKPVPIPPQPGAVRRPKPGPVPIPPQPGAVRRRKPVGIPPQPGAVRRQKPVGIPPQPGAVRRRTYVAIPPQPGALKRSHKGRKGTTKGGKKKRS